MFEYLMPSLVMREPTGSLLGQTNRLAVQQQIAHGKTAGSPGACRNPPIGAATWNMTYQYSNFGVPDLGLKRGLADENGGRTLCDGARRHDRPARGRPELRHFPATGGRGRYGYYEALDYTPARLPKGKRSRSCAPSWLTIRA